jgi:hypothetical protein
MFYGMESADEELLRRSCNKHINAERAEHILKETTAQGVFASTSFMYPLPFETAQTRAKTLGMLRRVFSGNKLASAILVNPYPFPRTTWWDQRAEFGFDFNDDAFLNSTFTFRARTLLPPQMQDSLPYTLNGRSPMELAQDLSSSPSSKESRSRPTSTTPSR